MFIEASSVDLAADIVKVALLSLSPNVALSLSSTLTVYSYIKRMIKPKKGGDKKRKGEKGA